MSLEVTPGGIDQIDPHTNRVVCSYDYRNVEGFVEVSDYQGGFCILYGGFSRLVCMEFVCVCICVVMYCFIKLKISLPPVSPPPRSLSICLPQRTGMKSSAAP